MSSDEEDYFGPESDEEEAPQPKRRPTRPKKKKKNPFITKLTKQVKDLGETNRKIEAAVRAQRRYELDHPEEELPDRPTTVRKRKRMENEVRATMQNPILVREDDIERRAAQDPTLAKIERNIWVKRTRYYPYNVACNRDVRGFYTTKTDLCCMWCTLPINDVPVPLPVKFSKSQDGFYVSGQYCSISCMFAEANRKKLRPCAAFFLARVYGIRYDSMEYQPAPSPHILTKFGGPMTPEAYRNTLYTKGLMFSETCLPFIPFAAGIEEVERVRTVIYEYGDEEKINRVVNSNIVVSRPAPIENSNARKMQVSKFSKMPTLEEQIAQSERKLRLQMQETGMEEDKKKKPRTLRDFMNIKSSK
jgi:hypothetical protein